LYQQSSGCAAHDLNRGQVRCINEKAIIGNTHAIQHVFAVHGRRTQLQATLFKLISEELDIKLGQPPASYRTHSENVVKHTLLRTLDFIRSGAGDALPLSAPEVQRHNHRRPVSVTDLAAITFDGGGDVERT
jgi:hypothetical protein